MPTLLAITILALLLPATPERPAPDRTLRVFIFAGQSNMEGADTSAADVDRYPLFVGAATPQRDVRYWYMLGPTRPENGSGGWVPLQPDPRRKIFGPELTFARRVKASIDAPIAIIKSAWGGTTLARDWSPDEPSEKRLYERTMKLVGEALADLRRQRIPYRLEAVVWHQGENDMLDRNLLGGYGKRLGAFVARLRRDLGAPELAWFVGEISDKGIWGLDHRRNMQALRRQQVEVAQRDPRVWFVPTSHLAFEVMKSGQPHYHFGTEGQLQHGDAYARAYLRTLKLDSPSSPDGFRDGFPAPSGATVRVFVVAGQRSAEGEGAYRARIRESRQLRSFHKIARPQEKILYRYRIGGGAQASRDWVPLGPVDEQGTFGPELTLGAALESRLDDPIAILKVTDSAAALADWLPTPGNASRPQYVPTLTFIRAALDDLRSRGLKPVLEAVFWVPGEHDAYWGPFRQRYGEDLARFVGALRRDLKSPELRWFVAELADRMRWGQERLDELDGQIRRVADADPRLWFVRTGDVPTAPACVTFGTEGTLHLGQRLASRYLEVRSDD